MYHKWSTEGISDSAKEAGEERCTECGCTRFPTEDGDGYYFHRDFDPNWCDPD